MRRKVTEAIEKWDESGRATALEIAGARQVGKTYSVMEFGRRRYGEHFLPINFFDRPDAVKAFDGALDADTVIKNLSGLFRDFEFVPGETLIFLDEVQNCPRARTALKPLAMDGRYRIIAPGALLGSTTNSLGLNPMAYKDTIVMHPMDFEEFLWARNMPPAVISDVRDSIREGRPINETFFTLFGQMYSEYSVVGGMPEAVREFVSTERYTSLGNIHDNIYRGILEDISKYTDDPVKVRTRSCLESLPSFLAGEKKKKFTFNRVRNTDDPEGGFRGTGFMYFAPALDWLSRADITLTCNNVTEPARPLEERVMPNSFKLYMMDTGLLTSRYDDAAFEEVLYGNPGVNAGAIAENSVAQAFACQGRRLMYYSRDDPRMEVDFVTIVGGRVCGVEVKSGSNRTCASLNRLIRERDAGGIMFETRNIFTDDKGVRHLPLFAASFMDEIDPREERMTDSSLLKRVIAEYNGNP